MRKLTLALAIGVLALASTFVTAAPVKATSTHHVKVVIVVGQTQSATAGYIAQAEGVAQQFRAASTVDRPIDVTTFYSPHATWAAVSAGAKYANVLIYMGHGNGYPNPYVGYLQWYADNGMGLDGPVAGRTYYVGEAQIALLDLAPNAIVILNHLCYASGNSEPGNYRSDGLATATETQYRYKAKTRVEGYASGFLRAGAGAVIAEGINDISEYVTRLTGTSMNVYDMWANSSNHHWNATYPLFTWTSSRNVTATAYMDRDWASPRSDGDTYYRSLVIQPGLTTGQVMGSDPATFTPQSGSYYPIAPTRVIDTRGNGVGPVGKLSSNGVVNYQIAGLGGVPADAIAVTANVTITDARGPGWLYIAPTITSTPGSSTINFPAGDDRANGITVGLSSVGTIAVWFAAGGNQITMFIVDVTGYFRPGTSGAGYVAYEPTRFVDTRGGTSSELTGRFAESHHRTFAVAGQHGLPVTGIVAVVANITVFNPSAAGWIQVGPDPTDTPTTSTINFRGRDTRANNVIVPLNADGSLSATYRSTSATATTDVIFDISGYFTYSGGTLYHTMLPQRLMDTRVPTPSSFTRFLSGAKQNLPVWGHGGVPSGAVAISGNLTMVNQSSSAFAAIGPQISADTNFSNLNSPRRDTRANGVTVPIYTGDGSVDVLFVCTDGGRGDLILDVSGYYQDPA